MPIYDISNPSTANRTFLSCLKKHDKVVCLYHWKQCGHCVDFVPIWQKITNLHKDKVNVINIELECMRKLSPEYQRNGFPSVVVYQNGIKSLEYNDRRTEENLDNFFKKYLIEDKPQKAQQNKAVKPPAKAAKATKPAKATVKKTTKKPKATKKV